MQNPHVPNDQFRIRGLLSYRRQRRLGLWLFLCNHRDNAILIADDVNVAFLVFADGADGNRGIDEEGALPLVVADRLSVPKSARGRNRRRGKHPAGRAGSGPAIDGPAHDCAPYFVVVFGHGRGLAFGAAYPVFDIAGFALNATPLFKTDAAFGDTPAVVFASGAGCGLIVHFFYGYIADVGDVEIACLACRRRIPRGCAGHRPRFRRDSLQLA